MRQLDKKLVFRVEYDNSLSPYTGRKQDMDIFTTKYLEFREKIIEKLSSFAEVDVVVKEPPKTYQPIITKTKGSSLYHDGKHNRLVHYPRNDSFQVSVDGFVVFSRLKEGGWPKVDKIVEWSLRVLSRIDDQEQEVIKEAKMVVVHYDKNKNKNKSQTKSITNYSNSSLGRSRLRETKTGAGKRNSNTRASSTRRTLIPSSKPISDRYSTDKAEKMSQSSMPKGIQFKSKMEMQVSKFFTKRKKKTEKQMLELMEKVEQRNHKEKERHLFQIKERERSQRKQRRVQRRDYQKKIKHIPSFHWDASQSIPYKKQNKQEQQFRRRTPTISSSSNRQSVHEPLPKNKKLKRKTTIEQVYDDYQMTASNQFSKKQSKQQEPPLKKIQISIDERTKFDNRKIYEVKDEIKVRKIARDDRWEYIICENQMPLEGQYYFAVSVVRSVDNNIEVGVGPLSFNKELDFLQCSQDKFVLYNCYNGRIKDNKHDEYSNYTCWRSGGQRAPLNNPFQMRVALDMDKKIVDWYVEDAIVASTKLPRIFKQGFRVVFSLYNEDDSILLNEEDWKGRLRLSKFDNVSYFLEPKKTIQRVGKIQKIMVSPAETQYVKDDNFYAYSANQSKNEQFDTLNSTQFAGKIRKQRLHKYTDRKKDANYKSDIEAIKEKIFQKQSLLDIKDKIEEIKEKNRVKREEKMKEQRKEERRREQEAKKNKNMQQEENDRQQNIKIRQKHAKKGTYQSFTDQQDVQIFWQAIYFKKQGFQLILQQNLLDIFQEDKPKFQY